MKIDLNRGVTHRRHPTTGVQVFMYKDDPGVFLSAHGTELDPSLAEACGFDVETLLKDKLKRERMAVAMATIDAEFATGPGLNEVVRTQGGFKLVAVGLGRHKVLDPNGEELHAQALTLEEANLLLDQLTHTPPVEKGVAESEQTVPLIEDTPKPHRYDTQPAKPVYPKPPLAHVKPAKTGKGKSKT